MIHMDHLSVLVGMLVVETIIREEAVLQKNIKNNSFLVVTGFEKIYNLIILKRFD